MNRGDFQKLAQERLKEAQMLLQQKCYSGAYYLSGYVIECGLKACIAKQTKKYDFPPEPKIVRDIYVHDIGMLVKAAGLTKTLDQDLKKDKVFEINWAIVKDWNEESRYASHTQTKAQDLYNAISDKKHGVLSWLSQRW